MDTLEADDRFTTWAANLKKVIRSDEELSLFGDTAIKQLALDKRARAEMEACAKEMEVTQAALFQLFVAKIENFKILRVSPEKRAQDLFTAFFAEGHPDRNRKKL